MKKIAILFLLIIISCKQETKPVNNFTTGEVFGTYYNIQFFDDKELDYSKQYDSLFSEVNKSMSTYITTSDISKINKGDTTIVIDHHFKKVFEVSKEIYKETNGFFDPTIGVLVNAWDFGPEREIVSLDSLKIDSLMQSVGFKNLMILGGKINNPKNAFIDFNAIGKGYGLDVVSEFLNRKGHQNYLIDIGGEIVAKGINVNSSTFWRVGIEEPNYDGTQSHKKVVELESAAMATSGVYRKFKVDVNGAKYSHIINAKTGYPSKTNILSVSVIASTCTIADAYATAFKAMGIEKVTELLKTHPELKVYFIYEDKNRDIKTLSLNSFP